MSTFGVKLTAPVNLRDLGGIAITGGILQQGVAIRSDDLAYIPEEVAQQLVARGLTSVIDLRSPAEASATGRGALGNHVVSYHHLPLIANVGNALTKNGPAFGHEAMGEMYVRIVEGAAPQLVTALNIIAYAPGTTAFHCAAGRDRTGVLAAVLLLVLGSSDDDIVTDYARTGDNMAAVIERIRPAMSAMRAALGVSESDHATSVLLDGSMDISMRMLLSWLRDENGDALAPLREAGLSDDTVARLRARALAS